MNKLSIFLMLGIIGAILVGCTATPLPREPVAPLPQVSPIDTSPINEFTENVTYNITNEPVLNITEVPAGDNFVSKENVLQNKQLTPGALNEFVTQDTINETICVSGYTTTIRPSSYDTNLWKLESMKEYGYAEEDKLKLQYDHLIALELGGCARCLDNLWPEPYPSANFKDTLENKLHKMVCNGSITLKEAQDCIVEDWTKCADKYGVVITYK